MDRALTGHGSGEVLTRALSDWFDRSQRPLPWRRTYDPYHVWLSEAMLQQTQVETVLPYYARFLDRFPTIDSLAASAEQEVLALWSGLGYYSRARNMRAAARRVAAEHGGRLPADHDRLLDLPGIGRYMAGAIMSIAFNEPYPIVDGNVRRVLARLNGWIEPVESELWNSAGDIVRSGVPRTVNQAMMELGATVCTFRAPDCESCPWKRQCVAHRTGRQAEIPAARKRPKTIRVDLSAVVDSSPEGVLMREAKGLWEFPMLPAPPGPAFHRRGHCRHWITHHRLEVDVYEGRLAERDGCRRVRFEDVPVTSLTRKIHAIVSASRDDASSKRPTGPIEP